jgi:glutamine synthetase
VSFVERHGLWDDDQFDAAAKAEALIEDQQLETVRLSFADQHGILRDWWPRRRRARCATAAA